MVQALRDLRLAIQPARLSDFSPTLDDHATRAESFALLLPELCTPGTEQNPSERCTAALSGLDAGLTLLAVDLASTSFT